ncbi:MAG: hypothetical protein HYZ75_04930 [Elusimicrobia bacterium]|nr:hypothetical protein [Elusimicrobiota bacterium]
MRFRRTFAGFLVAALALATVPPPVAAQLARTVAVPAVRPMAPGFAVVAPAAGLAHASLSLPSGLTPSPLLAVPSLRPAMVAAPVTAAAIRAAASVSAVPRSEAMAAAPRQESVPARVERLTVAAAKDAAAVPNSSASTAHGTAERGFQRLLGLRGPRSFEDRGAVDAPVVPALFRSGLRRAAGRVNAVQEESTPAPKTPDAVETRLYIAGTALFKVGAESLGLAVPLIALVVFGQAKWAAGMAMGWGLAQIIGSSVGGGLLDRNSATKVLTWSIGLQAVTVAGLLSLFAAQAVLGVPLAHPAAILSLHVATGILAGVSDTARQVIPPTLIGDDGQDLKVFNSKVHIAYEIAGVTGALLAGVLIRMFGVVPVLALHPPAFLLAAWAFSRMKASPVGESAARSAAGGVARILARAWEDLKAGAAAVRSSQLVLWASLALAVPLVLHRLLESLLIPVAAKTLLGDPSAAAWLMGASNFGELIGAVLLMRTNLSDSAPAKLRSPFWVGLMSVGLLGVWVFTFAPSVWWILPFVAFRALSWAASDLSLRSKLQESLAPELRGRTFGFLTAAAFGMVLLSSLALGLLFDAFPAASVFLGLNAGLTLAAIGLFYAARRLASTYKK